MVARQEHETPALLLLTVIIIGGFLLTTSLQPAVDYSGIGAAVKGDLARNALQGQGADIDGDGIIGSGDLAALMAQWGDCVDCSGDLDDDGIVGSLDLSILLALWNEGDANQDIVFVDNRLIETCATYSIADRDCTGTAQTAFPTLQDAADATRPGQIIYVRAGTYDDTGVVDRTRGYRNALRLVVDGQENAPITISSFNDEHVILDARSKLQNWRPCTVEDCGPVSDLSATYFTDVSDAVTAANANAFENAELMLVSMNAEPDDWQYFRVPTDNWISVPDIEYTSTSLVDPTVFTQSDASFWEGGYILLHTCNNNVLTRRIQSYDPQNNKITFDAVNCPGLMNAVVDSYVIWNHPSFLDTPGEYVIDEERNRIIAMPLLDVADIKVVSRDIGIHVAFSSHYIIEGLDLVGYPVAVSQYIIGPYDSYGLTLRNNIIREGLGGIELKRAHDVLIEENYIRDTTVDRGIEIAQAQRVVVKGNTLERIGKTGVYFGDVQDGLIVDNVNTGSQGQHANAYTVYDGSKDVVVQNNVAFNSNIGVTFQAVENILVKDNLIVSASNKGIAGWGGLIDDAQGTRTSNNIVVEGNTVIRSDIESGNVIYVHENMEDVTVRDNIAGSVPVDHSHYNNLLVTNNDLGYYPGDFQETVTTSLNDVFVNYLVDDYRLRGGFVGTPSQDMCSMSSDNSYVGAVPCLACESDEPFATFTSTDLSGLEIHSVTFDASTSEACAPDTELVSYEWDFGDGVVQEGTDLVVVTHDYDAGSYVATLTVTDGQGRIASFEAPVQVFESVESGLQLYYTFDNNDVTDALVPDFSRLPNSQDGIPLPGIVESTDNVEVYVPGVIDSSLYLDGASHVHVTHDTDARLRGMSELTMSLFVKKQQDTDAGNILSRHTHYRISSSPAGTGFELFTEDGTGSIVAPPLTTDWHHLLMTYDGGVLRAYIDGQLVGTNTQVGGNVASFGFTSRVFRFGANSLASSGLATWPFVIDEFKLYDLVWDQNRLDQYLSDVCAQSKEETAFC